MIRALARFAALVIFVLMVAASAESQTVTQFIGTGSQPIAAAVNPATNRIYLANSGSNTVTVIDGATNLTATVAAGNTPVAVAVNPTSNKIYVANIYDDSITEIDGATNATTTIPVGSRPIALAVNPVTDKIYVANFNGGNITVINGANNTTSTVATGSQPRAVAVNPATGTIYVANAGSNSVTVISGSTYASNTAATGEYPFSLAVNPATNLIYIANRDSNNVTVLNGSTHATATVAAGTRPVAVAVNPVTNKIYVANYTSYDLTVIDGAANTTTTVLGQFFPIALAVNITTNQIYVANQLYNTYRPAVGPITVIDGTTNIVTPLITGQAGAGFAPSAVAVNPVTNRVYIPDVAQDNLAVVDGAINVATIPGNIAAALASAQNPVTNKIYITDLISNRVTVIDGTTGTATTIPTGVGPDDVVVNPVTNKVYVSNYYDVSVTEIDGATNATNTILGVAGRMAVNPVTNKIYVATYQSGNLPVAVIDGDTNAVTNIPVTLTFPYAVDVNPVTDKIYVSDAAGGGIAVIDGATNTSTTILRGASCRGVAVNPLTNRIYSAIAIGDRLGTALVVDGASNAVTELPIPAYPTTKDSIAVDLALDKIYIADASSSYLANGNMTVVDGVTNAVTTIATPDSSTAVTVNQATGKIYLTLDGNNFGYGIAVFDGAGNSAGNSLLTRVQDAYLAAVNPVTNVAYAAVQFTGDVAVLSDRGVQPSPLTVTISPLTDNATTTPTPAFTFKASSSFAPHDTTPRNVVFQVDTWQGTWTAAISEGSGKFQATTSALLPGFHILYAYATDGQQATSIVTGAQSSSLIGSIAAYGFLVVPSAD